MPTPARAVLRALTLLIRIPGMPGRLLINTLDRMKARNGVGPLNTFQRGAVHAFVWFCALVFVPVAINPSPTSTTSTASSTATTSTAAARPAGTPTGTTSSSGPASAAPAEPAFGINPETVTVATITDGDTFQLTDGRKVRVLGIDSCEDTGAKKTPGGADATISARVLDDQQVVLTSEPGVDLDGNDRLLRYVWSENTSGDFGVWMVRYDHTGVYQGDNDASQAYLDTLYAHDLDYAANPPSGRECGEFPPPVPAPNDDDAYVPVPDNDDDDDPDRGGRSCRWNPFC